jgi:hypothetical protein
MSRDEDDKLMMEDGVAKILKKKEYDTKKAPPECIHEADGHEYGRTNTYIIRRCSKCGVHYEEKLT